MDLLKVAVEDCFNCFNIPIRVISSYFDFIYELGYMEYHDNIFPSKNLEEITNNHADDHFCKYIEVGEDIYYMILLISDIYKESVYFTIGPFTISKYIHDKNILIPYKSSSIFDYLDKFTLHICKDILNRNLNSKFINPYIRKSISYLYINYDKPISIDMICDKLNINKCYFCRLFKQETGFTFTNFLNNIRVEKSKNLLINSNLNLLEIAYAVGFNNQNYYTMIFKKFMGKTPSEYRNIQYKL